MLFRRDHFEIEEEILDWEADEATTVPQPESAAEQAQPVRGLSGLRAVQLRRAPLILSAPVMALIAFGVVAQETVIADNSEREPGRQPSAQANRQTQPSGGPHVLVSGSSPMTAPRSERHKSSKPRTRPGKRHLAQKQLPRHPSARPDRALPPNTPNPTPSPSPAPAPQPTVEPPAASVPAPPTATPVSDEFGIEQ